MPQSKSVGIVVRVRNFGEADRIYTILTKDRGKVSVLAKGVRKIKSKRAGSLDLLNEVNFSFDDKYSIPVLTEVQLLHSFEPIKNDLNKIKSAYIVLELIDKFIEDLDVNEGAYRLLKGALVCLETVENTDTDLMLCYFELKLLESLGYNPEVSMCTECEKHYSSSWLQVRFSFENGGLVCEDHNNGLLISHKQVELMRFIQANKFAKVLSEYSGFESGKTEQVVRGHIEYLLSGKIRSAGLKFNQDLMAF